MKTGIQATASSLIGFALLGVALFLPAGTFNYWQAWLFIAVFVLMGAGPSIYWALRRPEVLQRRMNAGPMAETRPAQKIIAASIYVWFTASLVVSALDHRFGWSNVPTAGVLIGDVLVAVGLGISLLVVQQNSYAGANVTVESDQQLVTTGLYGLVRHPMYFGTLILATGVPLALGSYWGLVCIIPGVIVFVFRILDEENLLRQELDGYDEYMRKVHYRLVPGVW